MGESNYGNLILEKRKYLAKTLVNKSRGSLSGQNSKIKDKDLKRRTEDVVYQIEYLAEAINFDHPELFTNYILNLFSAFENRDLSKKDVLLNLNQLDKIIDAEFDDKVYSQAHKFIVEAKLELEKEQPLFTSFISNENPYKEEVRKYLSLLLCGKREEAHDLIHDLMKNDGGIENIYKYIFQTAQYEVGYLWQQNKITVAHEHYCTAATQFIMSTMYPYIFSTAKIGRSLVTCSLSGELHEMGGRMLSDFFEMNGWDTFYLGADKQNDLLQKALVDNKADVLAISVATPGNLIQTKKVIEELRADETLRDLKILVGGYVLKTAPDLWKKLGADGYAGDADGALQLANNLCK